MLKFVVLFLLVSCSVFRAAPTLESFDQSKLLEAVRVTGEGRGRLTLGDSQYVFSVDSILKDDDWIFAVTIPLHGEEVMILPELTKSQIPEQESESFEERIGKEFQRLKLNRILTSKAFIAELRSMVRLVQSNALGLTPVCELRQNNSICTLEQMSYELLTAGKEFIIKKSLGQGKSLQLVAKNLRDASFAQTQIRLYLSEAEQQQGNGQFSLELFWSK